MTATRYTTNNKHQVLPDLTRKQMSALESIINGGGATMINFNKFEDSRFLFRLTLFDNVSNFRVASNLRRHFVRTNISRRCFLDVRMFVPASNFEILVPPF